MANTKALCVFTSILGNASMAQRLVSALDRVPGLDPTYVILGAGDHGGRD
jgi:hypothetical protein